jgi:hypothetical protein
MFPMVEFKVNKYEGLCAKDRFLAIKEEIQKEAEAAGFNLKATPGHPGAGDLRLERIEEDGLVYSITKVESPNTRKVE